METKGEQVDVEKSECPNCGREMTVVDGQETCVCGAEEASGCGCGGACGCGGHH